MDIELKTKLNVGDSVYLVVPECEVKLDSVSFTKIVYPSTVEAIRALYYGGKLEIEYFFKGLQSYEGENWFSEDIDPEDTFSYRWFADEASAREYCEKLEKDM